MRERNDVARAPASGPEKQTGDVRRDLASGPQPAERAAPAENTERRVEARRAAEDARLERFRADELPLATSRALDAFTDIASRDDSGDAGLAGIDILV